METRKESNVAEGRKHRILKQVAMRWVQGTGCVAWAFEVSMLFVGIVDVYGIKANGDVYIVEAKASQADFKNDLVPHGFNHLSKTARLEHSTRFDFVYYIVADGVDPTGLPAFVGLLNEMGRVKRNASRRPRAHNLESRLDSFSKIARACSWRAYGHIIRGESEQMNFSLFDEVSDG